MLRARQPRIAGRLACCALAACVLQACKPPQPVDLVIHDATIIDLDGGELITGKAVVVDSGLIHGIVPVERLSDYAAATTVDGTGGFLVPALVDAHVHVQSAAELDSYVRYGVGMVVNMGGGEMHLRLREAVAEGRRDGPEIVTVGPTLDGAEPTNPLFTSVTPETADEVVQWIADKGYDAVKVYQQMDAPTLAAVVRAAESRGMITTGHVSRGVGIEGVLEAGLRYVAHGEELAFESFDEQSRRFDRGDIPDLVALLSSHAVTLTPMISYLESVPPQVMALDDYLGSEPMSLAPASLKLSFGPRQGWFSNRDEPAAFAGQMADVAGFVAELTVACQEAGVPLILGTDAGFGGAIPGFSVHQELQSLVRAGLSELEALRTATVNVGRFLQRIDPRRTPWGRVQPGYTAGLLLLRGNPLQEISATLEIEGVWLGGRWRTAADLATLEGELRGRQSALEPLARAFEQALVDGDVEGARRAVDARPPGMADEPLAGADNCVFLGYRHDHGGRRELAGRLYEICAEMHPTSAPLWLHIARAREAGGDTSGAIDAYERALAANPWFGRPAEAIRQLADVDAAQSQAIERVPGLAFAERSAGAAAAWKHRAGRHQLAAARP